MSIQDPNNTTSNQAPEQRVKEDLNKVKETAQRDMDEVRRQAAKDVNELKDQAMDQVGAVGEKAKSFANDQKDLAAGQIDGVASAMNKVADQLEDQPAIARYTREVAGSLSRVSSNVRDRDAADLMEMAQDFGRRQPLAFLGIAALAGFAASRFAMSSSHRRDVTGPRSTASTYGAGTSYGTTRGSTVSTPSGSTGSTYSAGTSYGAGTSSTSGGATSYTSGSSTNGRH